MTDAANIIAFQGPCQALLPHGVSGCRADGCFCPVHLLREMILSVQEGRTALAMVPWRNFGDRVADIHHLLPESGLFINGEHFQRVNHQLFGAAQGQPLTTFAECIATHRGWHNAASAFSHLACSRSFIPMPLVPPRYRCRNDKHVGAIASALAAEIYDLDILVPSARCRTQHHTLSGHVTH